MSMIPPEVHNTLVELNVALKKLNSAVKDFTTVSSEEMQTHPNIGQAEFNLASMQATNILSAVNMKLRGLNPEDDDELRVELKRAERLKHRFDFASALEARPILNVGAASRFIKNALFDPFGKPIVEEEQKDWGECNTSADIDVEMLEVDASNTSPEKAK